MPCRVLSRWTALLTRLRGDARGAAAVQFALVAVPFLAILFATVETALSFWTAQVLQSAVTDTARRLYTGDFQVANTATPTADIPANLKTAICSHIVAMFECNAKLKIDVQTYTTLPSTMPSVVVTDANGKRILDPSFGAYNRPAPNQIVLVRAVVLYPVMVGLLGADPSNLNATTRLLMGSAAFRTEPYL